MTAILGGIGAACCWAIAMLCSARASRSIGAWPALAWVMLIGLVAVVPFVLAAGPVPTGAPAGWLLFAGATNVAGLLIEYHAVRSGKVGVVASIVSTEGAVAAVISSIAGEPIAALTAVALAVIAVGIVFASFDGTREERSDGSTRAVALAGIAAVTFGASLYAAGHASSEVGLGWVMLPGRLVGAPVLALALAVRGRLRIARDAVPFVAAAGLAEVAGIGAFAIGARDAIAVTSVLGSQFAALAAVGAFFVFGERLRKIQLVGVCTILAGVTWLAVLRG